MTLDLSIVIPAYNETARIEPTLRALVAFLGTGPGHEILVVDDGSTDGTAAFVERLATELPGLRVLRQPKNGGKGCAVRAGMLAARGRVRVMCDADGSMPATELPRLLRPIARGDADIAIGSRYATGSDATQSQPGYRVAWSRLCNWAIQRALVPGVADTQCGFKAFTAEAAQDLFGRATIDGWAFDLEVLALARRRGYAISEVGVRWVDDARSKVKPLDALRVVREALIIRGNLRRQAYGQLAAVGS